METLALADFHALIAPRKFFSEYVKQLNSADRRLLWRRPIFISLIVGVASSLSATHSVSLGLTLSTALLWLFLPLTQALALFAVIRNQLNGHTRWQVLDAFLVSNLPWLLWLTIWACIQVWLPLPTAISLLEIWFPGAALVALAWSLWLDVGFFRHVLGRSTARALLELLLQRLIAWPLFLAVFEYAAVIPSLRERVG